MIPIVSSAQIAHVDTRAQHEAKIPELLLMESAGLQAFQTLKRFLAPKDRLLLLVGGGNNGGDALVVSRYAYNAGYTNQQILYLSATEGEAMATQRAILATYPIVEIERSIAPQAIKEADWIIDGIAGTGLRGPLRPSLHPLIEAINASEAKVFSIDIPSGLGDSVDATHPAIKADILVTMGREKIAFYHPQTRLYCGEIVVVNPTFPPALLEDVPPLAHRIDRDPELTAFNENTYKKTRGHLGIWGGSAAYSGAPRLSANAAFASRTGVVSLHCDAEIHPIVATENPSLIIRPAQEMPEQSYAALLAGPGWGSDREELLGQLLALEVPTVLDADGIRAYVERGCPAHSSLILTPHLGELAALLGEPMSANAAVFIEQIQLLAQELAATLVVKSSLVHIISKTGELWIVEGRNPSLGVAGSGDVLAGIIASLLAQGNDSLTSAVEGTLIHQRAGAAAHTRYGYYNAEQLLEQVGSIAVEAER